MLPGAKRVIFARKPAKADAPYLRYGKEVFAGLWTKRALLEPCGYFARGL